MTPAERQTTPPVAGEEEPIPPQMARVATVVEGCLAAVLPQYIARHEAKYGRAPEGPQDEKTTTETNGGR